GLARGDDGVEGLTAGDDRVEPAQQGRGAGRAGLACGELVAGPGGQVGVAVVEDLVVGQGAPHGSPGGHAQPGAAAVADPGGAAEGGRGVLDRVEAGVLDDAAGAGEP